MLLRAIPDRTPSGPPPPIPSDDLEETVQPATVAAMLDNLQRLVAFEEAKAIGLTSRGTGLAGFAGLTGAVLAVAGASARSPVASKVFVVLAVLLLLASVGGIVLGMLTTREAPIQSARQVALYTEPGYRSVSPARVQVQTIDTLVRRLPALRKGNRRRATWLNRSAFALVLAIASAALAAVIRLFA